MEARRLNVLWSFGFLASQPYRVTIPRLYETQYMTNDRSQSVLGQKLHHRRVKGPGLLNIGEVPGRRQYDQL